MTFLIIILKNIVYPHLVPNLSHINHMFYLVYCFYSKLYIWNYPPKIHHIVTPYQLHCLSLFIIFIPLLSASRFFSLLFSFFQNGKKIKQNICIIFLFNQITSFGFVFIGLISEFFSFDLYFFFLTSMYLRKCSIVKKLLQFNDRQMILYIK